ncbi:glycogen debranching N-terminal domain-containing protein [Thermococcus sp.]
MLAYNGAFVFSDEKGDMGGKHGFYAFDTRVLSDVRLMFDAKSVITVRKSFNESVAHYIGSVVLTRERVLRESYMERLTFRNATEGVQRVSFSYSFNVPMEDIFEVRGFKEGMEREVSIFRGEDDIRYAYRGVDGILRGLKVVSNMDFESGRFEADFELGPLEERTFWVEFMPYIEGRLPVRFVPGGKPLKNPVFSSREWLNRIFEKAVEDLNALTAFTEFGPVPLAGLPEFAAVFGRDSIITAYFLLPHFPEYALGVLRVLARFQGRREDRRRGEERGKILHELRLGELSQSGRAPFAPYYGTVDATPLYVMLAAEYLRWTGDSEPVESLRENLNLAVDWILKKLDEGDGYIRYSPGELGNQGWKDSRGAIPMKDGTPVRPPIALVEVQGYAYRALLEAGEITDHSKRELKVEAKALKKRFNNDFWLDGHYALALDGENRPSEVVASNMGHLLITGIADHEREIAERLFRKDMFSGLGIRTLSSEEKTYNPFSYHNGSVWPHDNAIIALGLREIGEMEKAFRLAMAVLNAARNLNYTLPELFSGIEKPAPTPRFNSPQAWGAASAFAFLRAILGLEAGKELHVSPHLRGFEVHAEVAFRGERYRIRGFEGGYELIRITQG